MTFLAYCSKKFTHKNAKLNQPSLFVTSYLQISPLAKIYLCSKDFLLSQMLVKVIWAIFRAGFIFIIWNYYQNIVPLIVFAITKKLKNWPSLQELKAFMHGLSKCLPEEAQSLLFIQGKAW